EQADEEEEAVKEDVGGSVETYQGMSRGDWQDHAISDHARSSRSHMQIDLFPGREADYPPIGYTGHMPPGYDYCYDTAPDGSS
ncbi:hypothetical protein Tco_0082621, partial [Tanacetum coccineum]